jgi:hypothetical protein
MIARDKHSSLIGLLIIYKKGFLNLAPWNVFTKLLYLGNLGMDQINLSVVPYQSLSLV